MPKALRTTLDLLHASLGRLLRGVILKSKQEPLDSCYKLALPEYLSTLPLAKDSLLNMYGPESQGLHRGGSSWSVLR